MSGQIVYLQKPSNHVHVNMEKAANDIRVILSNLQRLQDTLRSEWEGAAFQGFDQQFSELKPKVENFADLMQQINTQLDKTAQAMQQNDQDLSRNFGLQ